MLTTTLLSVKFTHNQVDRWVMRMRVCELFGRDFNRDALLDAQAQIWEAPPPDTFDNWPCIARVHVSAHLVAGRNGVLRFEPPGVEWKLLKAVPAFESDGALAYVSVDLASSYFEPAMRHAVLGGIVTVAAIRLGGQPLEEGIKRLLKAMEAELSRMVVLHGEHFAAAKILPPAGPITTVADILQQLTDSAPGAALDLLH